MKKYRLLKCAATLCLSAAFLLLCAKDIRAEYVYDKANEIYYTNTIDMPVGASAFPAYGGGELIFVTLYNPEDHIANIKSSSRNLLAKKTSTSYLTTNTRHWDSDLQTYVTDSQTIKSDYTISILGKKKGSYTVTFDVIGADNTVKCTKSVKVRVLSRNYYTIPVKSITYAGKDISSYSSYIRKTSGKLKVKLRKGYSLVSIRTEKTDRNGNIVTRKVRNGQRITLAKSGKYTFYSGTANPLIVPTNIIVTVKNKKTKRVDEYIYTLYTLNQNK